MFHCLSVDLPANCELPRHTYAVDAVCVVDAEQFVSGGQDAGRCQCSAQRL